MSKIEWDDSLSVGVAAIDDQHKNWIECFNSAAEAVEAKHETAQVIKTLAFLVDYTEDHFSTEEKYMTENDYPGLAEHKEKHDELKKTLADLVRDFQEEGATRPLADGMDTFLGNWLANHIHEVDMKFSSFVREKGITIPAATP